MLRKSGRAVRAVMLVFAAALLTQAFVVFIPGAPILVPPAQTGDYGRIHTIGVVSAVGSELRLFRFNALLDTTDRTRDIRDWKLDEVLSGTAQEYLSQRFTMVDIPLDPKTAHDAMSPGFFIHNTAPMRDFLKSLNRSDVDAFLVFRPYAVAEDTWGLSLNLRKDQTTEYAANYEIELIDAHTFATIAQATSRIHAPGDSDYFPDLTLPRGFPTDDKLTLTDDAIGILRRNDFASPAGYYAGPARSIPEESNPCPPPA